MAASARRPLRSGEVGAGSAGALQHGVVVAFPDDAVAATLALLHTVEPPAPAINVLDDDRLRPTIRIDLGQIGRQDAIFIAFDVDLHDRDLVDGVFGEQASRPAPPRSEREPSSSPVDSSASPS